MSLTYAGPPMAAEQQRRKSNRELALQALLAAGPRGVTNDDLMRIAGSRAGGRVQELRDRGYVVECHHEVGGRWRYVLIQPGARDRVQLVDVDPPANGSLF